MRRPSSPDIEAVKRLVERLVRVLAGEDPQIIGVALADTLAMLLAGHFSQSGDASTDELREGLLSGHIDIVRQLIPVNEKLILGRIRSGGH